MLSELQSTGLYDAAKRLGVAPFEVVRLSVAKGDPPESLTFTDDQIDGLREFGGIESWWGEDDVPDDDNPKRARVRAAVKQLIDRGYVGESTRMDNVWRGLPPDAQELLQDSLDILEEEGIVKRTSAPAGVQIAVADEGRAKAIAEGDDIPDSLSTTIGG